jgi:glycosyltransferase involved in cell wall biosynthesis
LPRLSVIIATYNRSDVLRCAIATVQFQTFEDWELIVVGDGCTDDTASVMAEFRDPRIRFVNLPENIGEQWGPANRGFEMAHGELIAYLNHDDLWFPDHLDVLVRHLDDTKADLVYALRFSVGQDGLLFCGMTNAELRYDPSHHVEASLWLVRRALIEELGGWRPATSIHARTPSQDLLTRAWQRGKHLSCHPQVTALMLHAGTRPNSFKLRDDRQQKELLARLSDPCFRETLVTQALIQATRRVNEVSRRLQTPWERIGHYVDRTLVAFGFNPETVRNRLSGRPKGWVVDHIRQIGGLPRLDRDRERK